MMFAKSAPENPGVLVAIFFKSTSVSSGLFLACNFNIASRSFMSGKSSITRRSNLPGLKSAGSSTSARFVAAITISFVFLSNPSISTNIWLRVCSRSSCPPPKPVPLSRPMASISSMKIIAGAAILAVIKRSLTRLAPTPTNISTNSDAEMWKKGTFASPATARASRVFPVPG